MANTIESIINPAEEKVIRAARRHWMSLVFPMFSALILGVAAIFGIYLLNTYQEQVAAVGPITLALLAVLTLLWLSALLAYANWRVYTNNLIILTDKHLYLMVQNSILSKTVSQFSLEQLEDVVVHQNGFLPTVLHYGSITVETAGERDNMIFTYAEHPHHLGDTIMEAHKDFVEGKTLSVKTAGAPPA